MGKCKEADKCQAIDQCGGVYYAECPNIRYRDSLVGAGGTGRVTNKTIVVEDRPDPPTKAMLNAVAESCDELGYIVHRWFHECGKNPLPQCDIAFLWNGVHGVYDNAIQSDCEFVYIENGWLPPDGHVQIDKQGINISASWAKEPLVYKTGDTVPVKSGKLLATLQVGSDVQIIKHSPWFDSDVALLKHLIAYSTMDVVVRPHPVVGASDAVKKLVMIHDKLEYDDSDTIEEAFEKVSGVACINSTCGIQAVQAGLPVLCYGEAIYRHEGAVWCMERDGLATYIRTQQLKHKICDLQINAQKAIIERVLSHQYTIDQIPEVVEVLL